MQAGRGKVDPGSCVSLWVAAAQDGKGGLNISLGTSPLPACPPRTRLTGQAAAGRRIVSTHQRRAPTATPSQAPASPVIWHSVSTT